MTLEDFEKSLREKGTIGYDQEITNSRDDTRKRSKHHHRQHNRNEEDGHRHKRHRRSRSHGAHNNDKNPERGTHGPQSADEDERVEKDVTPTAIGVESKGAQWPSVQAELKRDSWMESPSALAIDYTQKGFKKPPEPKTSKSTKVDFELSVHDNELNKHYLKNLADGIGVRDETANEAAQHEIDYTFGDAGAQWRMTKLKAVFDRADETGRPVEDIAVESFGDLRFFDDAREEQVELERRSTYGEGYMGKEKPNGELFQERKLNADVRNNHFVPREHQNPHVEDLSQAVKAETPTAISVSMDQTELNRLKARMLKAKLRGSSEAATLEAAYNNAMASFVNRKEGGIVVLGAMEDKMLAGGRRGEVKAIDTKRGRQRGLVEENEDMSIEDMVREERRTRNQAGGDGQRFAERIAKDGKFDVIKAFINASRHLLTICTG